MTDIPNVQPDARNDTLLSAPDKVVKARDVFGLDIDMEVPAFSASSRPKRNATMDPATMAASVQTAAITVRRSIRSDRRPTGYCVTTAASMLAAMKAATAWVLRPLSRA